MSVVTHPEDQPNLRRAFQSLVKDSLIVATALAHDLTIATRNGADFLKAGVRLINPFAG